MVLHTFRAVRGKGYYMDNRDAPDTFKGLYGGYITKAHVWWVKNVRSLKWIQQHPISEVMIVS